MEEEIEQLRGKLNSLNKISEEKIDAMNNLAALLAKKDPKEADELSQRAVVEARISGYVKGEAEALLQAGMNAYAQRHFGDALNFYNQSLSIFEALRNEEAIATVLAKSGNTKLQEGKYSDALRYYYRAISIRENLGDDLGAADLYSNSATILGLQGSYTLALQSHLRALKIFEKYNELARIASASTNIGLIHKEQHHYEEALNMFQRALKIRQEKNDLKSVSDLLNNIGNVCQEEKNFDEALRYHQQALRIREQLGDKERIAYSFSNLGNISQATGQKSEALEYYLKSLQGFKEINEKRGVLQSYNNLGELYFELGNYKEAHAYLNIAIGLAEETGLKNQLRKAVEFSSEAFAREEKFKEAYQTHVRYMLIDKEISSLETHKQIAQMTVRHEIEQKEREAEIERVKNEELTKAYRSLDHEKERSENLLLNILPGEVADELKRNGRATARQFDNVSILFTDFVGFTNVSERLSPQQLVDELHVCFMAMDDIISKYQIEKIKTIGDAYMAVSGLPHVNPNHAVDMIKAALEIREFMKNRKIQNAVREGLYDIRIGINSGSVVAGIVGIKKFAYDIWGDTVNIAARMEQNGEAGKVNISETTYQLVKDKFKTEFRGEIEAKNKGKMKMYFVDRLTGPSG